MWLLLHKGREDRGDADGAPTRAPTEEEGKKDKDPRGQRRGGWDAIWEGGRRRPSVRPGRSTAPPPPAREPPEMMRGVCPRAPLHGPHAHGMPANPNPAGCGSSSSRGRTQNNSMEGGRGAVTTVVQYVIRMRYLQANARTVQNLLLTSPYSRRESGRDSGGAAE